MFCANSNANANAIVNNVLFVAAFKSIRSIPYLLNDCSFSLPLGCARSDTPFHAILFQIDLVERVRFEIRYLVPRSSFKTVGGGEKCKAKSKSKAKAWWNSETSGSKAREWKW